MMLPVGQRLADGRLVYIAALFRSIATGLAGVLIGIYLARLGFSPSAIGLVVSAGLGGAALAALLVTLRGDRIGRRTTLVLLALLGAAGGIIVGVVPGAGGGWGIGLVAAAAFLGMLNGMGRDRGASLILDQAILATSTGDSHRTQAFAWYNILQDGGHALGALLAATPAVLSARLGVPDLTALRVALLLYGSLLLVTAVAYAGLSRAVEAVPLKEPVRISPGSRSVLWKISSLFAVDSLAGGFLTTAVLAYFFYDRFGASEGAVGLLFFGARILNAASHIGAAWLAKRIGLINTMVFTHIPSSLLLVTVPFAPSFPVAALLFLLREGLVEMDVPTRQSYVMAVVEPEARTFAAGVTHLVRLGSWAVAPAFAGLLMTGVGLATPLFVGAGMKIGYDLLLYAAFRERRIGALPGRASRHPADPA